MRVKITFFLRLNFQARSSFQEIGVTAAEISLGRENGFSKGHDICLKGYSGEFGDGKTRVCECEGMRL